MVMVISFSRHGSLSLSQIFPLHTRLQKLPEDASDYSLPHTCTGQLLSVQVGIILVQPLGTILSRMTWQRDCIRNFWISTVIAKPAGGSLSFSPRPNVPRTCSLAVHCWLPALSLYTIYVRPIRKQAPSQSPTQGGTGIQVDRVVYLSTCDTRIPPVLISM